jgi:hypothetical protein
VRCGCRAAVRCGCGAVVVPGFRGPNARPGRRPAGQVLLRELERVVGVVFAARTGLKEDHQQYQYGKAHEIPLVVSHYLS